jgi:hypothetical protein
MTAPPRLPDRLWHGTTAAFDRFDARRLGTCVANPTTQLGFFFSEDPEDAASWAWRALDRVRDRGPPRLLEVRLDLRHVVSVSEAKFRFYLQVARFATIERDRHAWIDAGHDGMTTIRGGRRWWCAFAPCAIEILGAEILEEQTPGPG